ncbi:MAG: hypothetical protein INQ03_16080 [Candidatus Heimdallarchaeota archaeon]|nr:hypothetical protein [Candidatus Heimdallarchaeota archaeon]
MICIFVVHPYPNREIKIKPEEPQELVLTDNEATHFSIESDKKVSRKWQGLVKREINYLMSLRFESDDSRSDLLSTILYPEKIEFVYTGANEQVYLPSHQSLLIWEYSSQGSQLTIIPVLAMRPDFLASSSLSDIQINFKDNILYCQSTGTKVLGISSTSTLEFEFNPELLPCSFQKDHQRHDGSTTENSLIPGLLKVDTGAVNMIIVIADSEAEIQRKCQFIINNFQTIRDDKKDGLLSLIQKTTVSAKLKGIDLSDSFDWAQISVQKLKMNRFGKGTYAGLHWFDDYWARDTFISFKGALLSSGEWEFARSTIMTMVEMQLLDSTRFEVGRVPNRVLKENTSADYHTADGLGWFIKAIADYIKYSGDTAFAKEIFPVIEFAIEGELSRGDTMGFVTHRARETWMDALTKDVIQTPRDDRAVEVQALLYQIYSSGIYVGSIIKKDVDTWKRKQADLLVRIKKHFWNGSFLIDHLNSDGSADQQIRPNQFLALSLLPDDFLTVDERKVLVNKTSQLITPLGVRTLDPADPAFKPSHDLGHWHHDEAYHNGDIWPWLSGATIEQFLLADEITLATDLLLGLHDQIINHNPAGGLGEVFDGSGNNTETVGAVFQLWSMAEYIRFLTSGLIRLQIDQDIICITDLSAILFDSYKSIIPFRGNYLKYHMIRSPRGYEIRISGLDTRTIQFTFCKNINIKNIFVNSDQFTYIDERTIKIGVQDSNVEITIESLEG